MRIWSTAGTDIIRYRFKDAIQEMPDDAGLQVHRSWWVDPEKVAENHRNGRNLTLKLENGLDVPVSLAYQSAVELALGHPEQN